LIPRLAMPLFKALGPLIIANLKIPTLLVVWSALGSLIKVNGSLQFDPPQEAYKVELLERVGIELPKREPEHFMPEPHMDMPFDPLDMFGCPLLLMAFDEGPETTRIIGRFSMFDFERERGGVQWQCADDTMANMLEPRHWKRTYRSPVLLTPLQGKNSTSV
jgi:hypothetical protein